MYGSCQARRLQGRFNGLGSQAGLLGVMRDDLGVRSILSSTITPPHSRYNCRNVTATVLMPSMRAIPQSVSLPSLASSAPGCG